jgi:hypothetical protein
MNKEREEKSLDFKLGTQGSFFSTYGKNAKIKKSD